MTDTELVTAATAAICVYNFYNYVDIYFKKKINKSWRKKRWWMLPIHKNRTRDWMKRQTTEVLNESSSGEFENFHRMSPQDFEYLLLQTALLISKEDTQLRDAIPAKVRLAITLWFLATGDSYKSLHLLFKASNQSISKIMPEVCSALNHVLKDECKINK
nr:uncharacterized protein LOC111418789 [Onthophagus taurus]